MDKKFDLPFPMCCALDIQPVWTSLQVTLNDITRWGENYLDKGIGVRVQTDSQHSHAMVLFTVCMMKKVRRRTGHWDSELLLTAVTLHDAGEGLKKPGEEKDVPATRKKELDNWKEYEGFCSLYSKLEPALFRPLERAFLLQFARNATPIFPAHAQKVMSELRKNRLEECVLFDAIENWDYMLFAIEQYRERGCSQILYNTIKYCTPHFEELSSLLSEDFNTYFWSTEMKNWCMEFLIAHEAEMDEIKRKETAEKLAQLKELGRKQLADDPQQ